MAWSLAAGVEKQLFSTGQSGTRAGIEASRVPTPGVLGLPVGTTSQSSYNLQKCVTSWGLRPYGTHAQSNYKRMHSFLSSVLGTNPRTWCFPGKCPTVQCLDPSGFLGGTGSAWRSAVHAMCTTTLPGRLVVPVLCNISFICE